MSKYLKQGFIRHLEWEVGKGNISYSKMIELIEEEVIKNYTEEKKNYKNLLYTDIISDSGMDPRN